VSALLRGSEPAFDHAVRTIPGDAGEEQGPDALRWHALTGQPGAGELLSRIWNAYELAAAQRPQEAGRAGETDLDRWIRSRLSAAIVAAGERLDEFDAAGAAAAVAAFADDLCGWYVRSCSERLLGGDVDACRTLRECLATLARLLAPFAPFVADEIYERLDGSEPSVHLSDWPDAGLRDLELEAAIGLAREA
jgi:isoleucyl-tRNA synthetase